MEDKLFVIAIGGTGMRCLESFVHLCAIGMFDNQEIEVLTLDTDQTNGNKARVESLINLYRRIKSADSKKIDGGTSNADTFFSAKLNLYRFYTNYEGDRNTYKNLSKITGRDANEDPNVMLSDLFLDKDTVQEFDLAHGYRAQAHLGSHLMYHGILEAARKLAEGIHVGEPERDLGEFLGKMYTAGENARIFVFGSVFGGTGASSIPIIPVACRDAVDLRSNGKETLNLKGIKFGSTLLTEYFTFKKPTGNDMKEKANSVIADASFFPINSQAALQFYQGDPTVRSVYKYLYHIGWPLESGELEGTAKNKTITGGAKQKNGCHVTELLCACAAYDFFNRPDSDFCNAEAEYVCRSAEYAENAFNFSAADFMGDKGELFMNKLGAFLSFAHIALAKNKAAWGIDGTKGFMNRLVKQEIKDYENGINDEQMKEIDNYLRAFAYQFDQNKNFVPGWIYQIRNSIKPGKFIFSDEAFKNQSAELEKIDVGKLFDDDKHNWEKTLLSNRYDTFVKNLVSRGVPKEEQKVTTTKEKFLAHIYNGITISQNFNVKGE